MITKTILSAALALGLAGPALAAGGAGHVEDVDFSFEGPFGAYDPAQLQRGLQVYVEVCAACHGLKFVPFRALGEAGGLGYDKKQVSAIADLFEVPDEEFPGDTRPAVATDNFPANVDAGAPDLSLMAKARAGFHGPAGTGISQFVNGMGGAEYIYSLLTGYTGEVEEVAGSELYKNETMAGGLISMAPPLEDDAVEYADETPATLEQMSEDVAAFLMWSAEPKLAERKRAGIRNIVFLVLLTVLLYFTNKKLWAGVKKRKAADA